MSLDTCRDILDGQMGSKEEKKGSSQFFYTACNKDPQIIYHLLVLFILMKSCEAHHCIHSHFQQSSQALQGKKLYKLPLLLDAAQAAAPT
jgi:hypothetical protein